MKKLLIALLFISTSVFANGDLNITSEKILPSVVPMNATGIPMIKVKISAQDETIYINKLVFTRTGLSNARDIKSIRATGPNIRSRSFPVMHDDTATINFFGKLIIPANTTQTLTITANLDVQGTGRTIGLELIEIYSTAEHTTLSETEMASETPDEISKSSPSTNQTIEVQKIDFTPPRLRLERWQKLGRLKLTNLDKKSTTIKSLYLNHDGTGPLTSIFHNLILTSRNSVVSHMATMASHTAKFDFLTNTEVEANSNRLIEIWGKTKRNKSTYTIDFSAENDDIITK